MYYFKREHRGGLKESLQTMKYISENLFIHLSDKYQCYGYDPRVEQVLFIAKDMFHTSPTWIGIGLDNKEAANKWLK